MNYLSTINRGLTTFAVTEDDILSNILNRYREKLLENEKARLRLKLVSYRQVIEEIYYPNHEFYPKRGKRFCNYRYNDDAPTAVDHPLFTIIGISFLIVLAYYLSTVLWPDVSNTLGTNIFLGIVIFLIWALVSIPIIKTLIHVSVDVHLANILFARVDKCEQEIEAQVSEYHQKLLRNKGLYTEDLITELKIQRDQKGKELNAAIADLSNLVNRPRNAASEQIGKLRAQMGQLDQLKVMYTDEAIEKMRRGLQSKIDANKKLRDQYTPVEQQIQPAIADAKQELVNMQGAIERLTAFRQEMKGVLEIDDSIRETLSSDELDWGYVEQSKYDREITRILSNISDLTNSIQQITSATKQAAGLIEQGKEVLSLAA